MDTIARLARQRTRSIVFLHTINKGSRDPESASDPLAPPPQLARIEEGLGSGVIIDVSGLILTSAHVIEGADLIHVRTTGRR